MQFWLGGGSCFMCIIMYINESMMYTKLLVLVGFDLHFPLISGIHKLHQIKAIHFLSFSFHLVLHPSFKSRSFYFNYKDL